MKVEKTDSGGFVFVNTPSDKVIHEKNMKISELVLKIHELEQKIAKLMKK